jgi:ribosome biogenesis GTPase A
MSIQWFPGHMTKARRELAESIPKHDVVIEVLDARAPSASENPLVTELRGHKPCLKVLSKSDLADPEVTEAWLRYFEAERSEVSKERPSGKVIALALSTDRPGEARTKVPELCAKLAPHRAGPHKSVRAMIVGIPNVGKSTLINTLMGRRVAKVGDEPAVTKSQQRVTAKSGMALSDSPGIMWPKIDDEAASYRLALLGAIPDSALDYETVALFGAEFLARHYARLLVARYKITALPDLAEGAEAVLAEIGRRRGCLRSGGRIDMHKAANVLLHDLRSGAIGRVTLERPRA